MQRLSIICPNGHLGFAPSREESFRLGVQRRPHYIAADSGSDDVGPVPLGSDTSTSPLAWQTHDLEQMLLASREIGVPMIIGSSGDTGANSRVDLYCRIIRELASKHGLAPFRLGWFTSEVDKELIRRRMRAGEAISGLDGRPALTEAELDATERVVAMADAHPFIALLRQGADVIIGGRSSDSAVFAAPAIHHGFPPAQAYYLGKVLECASFCAEPYGGKETVWGEVTAEDVRVTAMSPAQRCTVASVAGHAMYERSNPYFEHVASGVLDMSQCRYEQVDAKTTRITGSPFVPGEEFRVKLEGSGKVGERFVGMVAIRYPYTIAHVDEVIGWARRQVRERFGETGYELHALHRLRPRRRDGRDGTAARASGARTRHPRAGRCPDGRDGRGGLHDRHAPDVLCAAARRERIGRERGLRARRSLRASGAYRWTLNHTMRCDDPMELFPTHIETVDGSPTVVVPAKAGTQ